VKAILDRLTPWLLPMVLLLAWELAARFGLMSARVLPAPSDTARAFWETLLSGALLHHVWISTQRALIGLAIPLVILWFGIDEEAKLFLVAAGVLFPIYLNTFHGIRHVDRALIEMARSYGLGPWAMFNRVILPGALPSILVGLRYALGIMWLTLIVAETISASAGIGYMTMNAREFLQTDVVLLGIIIYALLGKIADLLTRQLEQRCLAWHPAHQAVGAVA